MANVNENGGIVVPGSRARNGDGAGRLSAVKVRIGFGLGTHTSANEAGSFENRVFDVGGQRYLGSVSELEETAQAKPRLVIVKPLEATSSAFETLKWMLFVPPLLVFIAVLFSMTGGRRTIVVTRAP